MADKPEVSLCVAMDLMTGDTEGIDTREYYRNDIQLDTGYFRDNKLRLIVYFHFPISQDAAVKATNEIRCRLKALDRIDLGRYDRETLAYLGK